MAEIEGAEGRQFQSPARKNEYLNQVFDYFYFKNEQNVLRKHCFSFIRFSSTFSVQNAGIDVV